MIDSRNERMGQALQRHQRTREPISQAHYESERSAQRFRTARRFLAGAAILVGLTALAKVAGPAVNDFEKFMNGDTNTPDATNYLPNQYVELDIQNVSLENGTSDMWPHLRSTPEVHNGNDGFAPNTISWKDVAKMGTTGHEKEVNIKDNTILYIENPELVYASNPDNTYSNQKMAWGVLDLTLQDGTKLKSYYSLSNETSGFVILNGDGRSQPIDQASSNLNEISETPPQQ